MIMDAVIAFFAAFFFSFVGSIPPGTLNLTIIQLGIEHHIAVAWRFAIAAALIEYPYAWTAVRFKDLILSRESLTDEFQLISAVVMIVLGLLNLRSALRKAEPDSKIKPGGFRRGLLLSILNPLALPYWIAITAYLETHQIVSLTGEVETHAYLAGVSLGALALLISMALLAGRIQHVFVENTFIKKVPGSLLIALGLYSLFLYLV